MPNLDALIDSIVATSRATAGESRRVLSAQGAGRAAIVAKPRARHRHSPWSQAEDDFLRAQHGLLSEATIGAALGRTAIAVHIRWKRELRLGGASRSPLWLTAEHVAMGLGLDGKSVHRLMDTGRMPCRRLPSDRGANIRLIERKTLLRWIVNPEHWIYFKPQRVGLRRARGQRGYTRVYEAAFWAKARRLMLWRLARWEDAWLTPGQASRLSGLHPHILNREIHAGRLPATRWGNWWIKRSDLLSAPLRLLTTGPRLSGKTITPAADAFLILARAVGLSAPEIAPLMGLTPMYVNHRLRTLRQQRLIPGLIRQFKLKVSYRRGLLFANWRHHAHRFPRLARVLRAFSAGHPLSRPDTALVRGVLHTWAAWHARTRAHHQLTKGLRVFSGKTILAYYHRLARQMRANGLPNPLPSASYSRKEFHHVR